MINVQFVGVDAFNRPVFKEIGKRRYYGSTSHLVDYGATEEEVLDRIDSSMLEYFGTRFNCEPMGTSPNEDIHIVSVGD